MAADYRNHRAAVLKAGARKSPPLPLALLTAARRGGFRISQIALATGLSESTVSAAFSRNRLVAERKGDRPRTNTAPAAGLPILLKALPLETLTKRRPQLLKSVSAVERARLKAEFRDLSDRLRACGLAAKDIAALSGRALQSVHQWRVNGLAYPAPSQDIIDDLRRAAARYEAMIGRATTILETFA
ncbi:hypothetical protein NKG99_14345 [Mesorhizobium sp. M1409]|uniref:hypothetical protein n=1 Tax=unclassified Mesorhizobium TaxID=325217 RepID=UPI00333B67B8